MGDLQSAYLDDLTELDVFFPTSSPPAQLVSDGHTFYEVFLQWTPSSDVDSSSIDVDMTRPPTSARETALTLLPHLLAAPMSTTAAVVGAAMHLVPFPPSPTGTASTGVVAPQPTLSDDAARTQIEAYIRTSIWFRVHVLESLVGESGVPVSALQLAKRGHSIWACFVKRVRRKGKLVFKCTACGHESDRLHRAVGHQRTKWAHKPFACTDPGCTFRGSTRESLSDHGSARTDTAPCDLCGEEIMIKNLDRHLKKIHRTRNV